MTKMLMCEIAVGVATLLSIGGVKQPRSGIVPNEIITRVRAESIRARMSFLADDLLEGRGTGTRGYFLAAKYVATEFERMGLEPGGEAGTFFQNVLYRQTEPDFATMTFDVRNTQGLTRRLVLEREWTSFGDPVHSEVDLSGGAIFVGYGITEAKLGYDNYRNAEAKGKIAVILTGTPEALPPQWHPLWTNAARRRNAALHGAIGAIFIRGNPGGQPFDAAIPSAKKPFMQWIDIEGHVQNGFPSLASASTVINASVAQVLFEDSGISFADALVSANSNTFHAINLAVGITTHQATKYSVLQGPNVAGILRGSDPLLRKEFIITTAHLDHLGIGTPRNGDAIYNGAQDNASGVAAMMEIADVLSRSRVRPRRSILFLAVGGEEMGLIGSDYFAEHTTISLGAIAANVNIDGIPITYDFKDVIALGSERSTIREVVVGAARSLHLQVSPDPTPEQNFFLRSDQLSFVLRGVPAVFISEGEKARDPAVNGARMTEEWFARYYHAPNDDMKQPLNFKAALRGTRFNLAVIYGLGEKTERPMWNSGDVFGTIAARRPSTGR